MIAVYIILFAILCVVETAYIALARHHHILSRPCGRSSHRYPTVTAGGVILPLALIAWWLLFGGPALFVLGGLLLAGVSFYDDVHPLDFKLRLLVQFGAVAMALAGAGLPVWLAVVTLVAGVGFVNIYNFMDGINGMTGAYTLLLLATLFAVNTEEPFIEASLLIVMLMAVAIFTFFNFRRSALCFAGDVGAVSAGFVIFYALVCLMTATDSIGWLALVAVYGVDAVLTILRRIRRKENIFKAHRMHLYQLLSNEGGFSQLTVATSYVAVQAVVNVGLIICQPYAVAYLAGVTGVLSAAWVLLVRRVDCSSAS